MAVDTQAKRFSMLNFGESDVLLPAPNDSITLGDQKHLLGLYSRILAPATGVVLEDIHVVVPRLTSVEVRLP